MLKDTVKKRLGYMVKNEREHLRLSQSALAEQAGVSSGPSQILKLVTAIRNLQR